MLKITKIELIKTSLVLNLKIMANNINSETL